MSSSPVPTISITSPDLKNKDYDSIMSSSSTLTTTPDSPTVFDVVKDIESNLVIDSQESFIIDNEEEDCQIAAPNPQKTIQTFYDQKCILITGATGFIGKAVLWKLIQSLTDSVDKIFLLLRCKRQQNTPYDRLQEDILSNKAFVSLRRSMGFTRFDRFIEGKVYPIFGDLAETQLGLSDPDFHIISSQTNIIFHCAGSNTLNLQNLVKINSFGTLQLLDLAKKCLSLSAFVSLSHLFQHDEQKIEENSLYPLCNSGQKLTAKEILNQILSTNEDDENNFHTLIPSFYNNDYFFSKALAEHILVEEVSRSLKEEDSLFPIAMLRLSPVGPSVHEPLIGWADGVNGMNGAILLTGKGQAKNIIQPHVGSTFIDVVPVDYVARLIIGCAATFDSTIIKEKKFEIPKEVHMTTISKTSSLSLEEQNTNRLPSLPSEHKSMFHKRTSSNSSQRMSSIRNSNIFCYRPSSIPSSYLSFSETLPKIYHISTTNLRPITWRMGYEAMRQYWNTSTFANLPTSTIYFNNNHSANGTTPPASSRLSRARTVMNSLRDYYMSQNTSQFNDTINPSQRSSFINEDRSSFISSSSSSSISSSGGNNSNSVSSSSSYKRISQQRSSRALEMAVKTAYVMRDSIICSRHSIPIVISLNTMKLIDAIRNMHDDAFDPSTILPEDTNSKFWVNYFMNASYGIHHYVCQDPNTSLIRLPTPIDGWSCSIERPIEGLDEDDSDYYEHVLTRQVKSVLFSKDQVKQRTTRMISHIKSILTMQANNKEKDDAWLTDLDDALDDWCQDTSNSIERRSMVALGKWRRSKGSNDESVKIIVLNDKRVNQAITQITRNAGVAKQTAVNEAMKILMRMSERTQLSFVWFTGTLLNQLFTDLFEHVRISDESLRIIRQATIGKRVVYVPVAKSILDLLLVWYIAIRYRLPVPALVCDESVMTQQQLGSLSDLYRLAGGYYVKRDKTKRSPLNSAVTAAYTQVLLREHGALSFCLERSRSRTGKFQEPYPDGFVEMIIESTLQTNQSRCSSSSSTSRLTAQSSDLSDNNSMTDEPPTNRSQQSNKKVYNKDVVFIPINITYEHVPELSCLIDEVLDQQQPINRQRPPMTSSNSSPSLMTGRRLPMMRPSETMDRRKTLLENDTFTTKKGGRVTLGVGSLISVQEVADEFYQKDVTNSGGSVRDSEETIYDEVDMLMTEVTRRIHVSQCKALVVSPISIIASIILYGRATHGVCVGKIKELMVWMRHEMIQHGYAIDWQEGEDLDSLILTSFKLLDEPKNLILDGREFNDDTNIRVNDHADNVMTLSYYANQIIDIFLLDSFFAIVYLSFLEESVLEDEFMDRFRFLLQLLEKEFVLHWDLDEKFKHVIHTYVSKHIIRIHENRLQLLVNLENDPIRYEQMMFLASLVYPTVDAYWITSCSLSALEAVPMLPRCIIPLLSQWIATHLITGRRTIYREVLSTESSKTAVNVFMSMGFLTEIKLKEKLSPDAQILLHELGIPTSEILIELAGQNSDGGKTPVSPIDPEGMMKAMMAQIEMNRANSNMADLCQQIDSYRLGAASQRESFQNAQVFQKCLMQIKGIILKNNSFTKRRQVILEADEEHLTQLVYSLLISSVPVGDRAAQARALRRISEAYNLMK
ncbi:male sterility protein-domain-containing protein [Cokeromyces recurvatus]|uniref:male sterility protein-domain-containing protein n=1 Tax=Cokeromyces recurvatus TaxID=90255 RepID=UPI002220C010|nr:male sterility protein-domain-containing protein [Cokeromyces recurvatus]KAI7906338.1 male sterility protein-domain-containing protein [Cokeromyces recurvatus]